MNPFQNNTEESERLHRCFFRAHKAIAAAHDEFNAALLIIQKQEEYSDTRALVKKYRVAIEGFRNDSESLMNEASEFRTEVIRETGCSGECHPR